MLVKKVGYFHIMKQHCWNNNPPEKLLLQSVPVNQIKAFLKLQKMQPALF